MHPYWAGYRSPRPRRVLHPGEYSALAGVIVSGFYMWGTFVRGTKQAAPPAIGNVVRHIQTPEEFTSNLITCVLFFGTVYAMGMALYRYFGDTAGYTVVGANAGQHMPLLFLVAGGALAGLHGTNVYAGRGRVFDWLMLAISLEPAGNLRLGVVSHNRR